MEGVDNENRAGGEEKKKEREQKIHPSIESYQRRRTNVHVGVLCYTLRWISLCLSVTFVINPQSTASPKVYLDRHKSEHC